MVEKTVTEAGFYAGKFLKPGQRYESDDASDGVASTAVVSPEVSDKLSKDELLAMATDLGVKADAGMTKAEIVAAINAREQA